MSRRVLVEALAAEFGGIRTYVENLLRAWPVAYPEDDIVVVVGPGSDLDTAGHERREIRVLRPDTIGRPLAQTLRTRSIAEDFGADVVLATLPSTSLVRTAVPTAVVVHDLRHEIRPEQFSRGRRILRRLSYGRAYAVADGFIAVSQRTLDDLHRLHPETRVKPGHVVHHGADHVTSWPPANTSGPAVAFAHHTNKNPDLVIRGWSAARTRGLSLPPLLILGVSGALRAPLEALIADHHIGDQVTLAPYLSDEEFRRAMSEAAVVVLPSDLEGFGLPVVEGMALGKPVVIGPDTGAAEVAGGHAAMMGSWTDVALADAVALAIGKSADEIQAATRWASSFTWERTVRETRAALLAISSRGKPDQRHQTR